MTYIYVVRCQRVNRNPGFRSKTDNMGCLAEIQFEFSFRSIFGDSPPLEIFISSVCKDVE